MTNKSTKIKRDCHRNRHLPSGTEKTYGNVGIAGLRGKPPEFETRSTKSSIVTFGAIIEAKEK
jgi:hypothetical protein